MDLTIIIVNWNTRVMLKKCLESIRQNKGSLKIEVIVVDNNSKDDSREMVETLFPEVNLINSGSNMGFGRANNLGFLHANTSLVMLLNPDTEVMKGTMEGMVDFMRSNETVGAMSCKITYSPGQTETVGTDGEAHTLLLQWFPSPFTALFTMLFLSDRMIQKIKKYLPYKDPNESGYVSILSGACIMIRREVLKQIGCFDEQFFMYAEDYDLCRRIKDAGWELYYMSEVKIIHYVGGASQETRSQFSTLMMCQSVSQLMEKYYGYKGKLFYKVVILLGSFYRLLILIILIFLSNIGVLKYNKSYMNALNKYFYMFKWSINIERAKIKE